MENFGERQADNYREVLHQAIGELNAGPDVPRSKFLEEIMSGLRTLHVAGRGRRGEPFPDVPDNCRMDDRDRTHSE
jgi:toxin ParE1/3/4